MGSHLTPVVLWCGYWWQRVWVWKMLTAGSLGAVQRRLLGASGLRVSTLGLGTATWLTPGGASAAEAQLMVKDFAAAGGSLIDVTPVPVQAPQPGSVQAGLLETIGEVIRRERLRDQVILSAASGVDTAQPVGRRVDCSRKAMLADLDRTLALLGTDYIDIWSPAYWDPSTPPAEVVDACEYAVRSGRVGYIGVRGFTGWQLAVTVAAAHRISPIVAQHEYSLLQRRPEEELLPAAEHLGIGFIAGAPLAQGVLTGKYQDGIPDDSRGASSHADAEVQDYLDTHGVTVVGALCTAAEGLGVSPQAAALAWTRDRPGVSSVLVSARNRQQLAEILESDNVHLPRAICEALDDVSL